MHTAVAVINSSDSTHPRGHTYDDFHGDTLSFHLFVQVAGDARAILAYSTYPYMGLRDVELLKHIAHSRRGGEVDGFLAIAPEIGATARNKSPPSQLISASRLPLVSQDHVPRP
jgi:hypothetical protein